MIVVHIAMHQADDALKGFVIASDEMLLKHATVIERVYVV